MFGIYSHNKLDQGGFWDAVSQHLQRRGPGHRERYAHFAYVMALIEFFRCLKRQKSSTDSGCFDPVVFISSPERYDNPVTSKDLDDSQLLQVCICIGGR